MAALSLLCGPFAGMSIPLKSKGGMPRPVNGTWNVPKGTIMAQHFRLSPLTRDITLATVGRMSDEELVAYFVNLRWGLSLIHI